MYVYIYIYTYIFIDKHIDIISTTHTVTLYVGGLHIGAQVHLHCSGAVGRPPLDCGSFNGGVSVTT